MDKIGVPDMNYRFTKEVNTLLEKTWKNDLSHLFKGLIINAEIKLPQEEVETILKKYIDNDSYKDITLTVEINKDHFNPFIIDGCYKGINIEPQYKVLKSQTKPIDFLTIVKEVINQETHKPIISY